MKKTQRAAASSPGGEPRRGLAGPSAVTSGDAAAFLAFAEEVRAATDIAEVVAERTRRGGGELAQCPFHRGRKPTLRIDPADGSLHCDRYGSSGDAFRFVEQVEKVSFLEAMRLLGERAGSKIPLTTAARLR